MLECSLDPNPSDRPLADLEVQLLLLTSSVPVLVPVCDPLALLLHPIARHHDPFPFSPSGRSSSSSRSFVVVVVAATLVFQVVYRRETFHRTDTAFS